MRARKLAMLAAGLGAFGLAGLALGEPAAKPSATLAPTATTVEPATAAEARQALIKDVYHRATTLAQAGDEAGARKVLAEFAQAQGKGDPYYDELDGTLLAIAKDYRGAQAAFERLLGKTPDSHVGRFNHAEMLMLQEKFAPAEREFAAVEAEVGPKDPALADLCRFKRVMCLVSDGKTMSADALVPPLQENSESPALCFARAALEYAKKNETKAEQLLEDARSRFPPGVGTLYTDSMVELRWGRRDESGMFSFMPRGRQP